MLVNPKQTSETMINQYLSCMYQQIASKRPVIQIIVEQFSQLDYKKKQLKREN